jgi:anti-sigma factor RsiW
MTCQDVARDELAERYVAGQLDEAQQEAFEQHFFQCPRCTEDVGLLQDLRAALVCGSTPALGAPRRAAVAGPATWRWLAVAAVFVLVAALGWRVWRPHPHPHREARQRQRVRSTDLHRVQTCGFS